MRDVPGIRNHTSLSCELGEPIRSNAAVAGTFPQSNSLLDVY
jgi:hypothetical protein